jgi:hypothetical protein
LPGRSPRAYNTPIAGKSLLRSIAEIRMPFTLDQIVPWGRSFEEYVRMFRLTDEDREGRILGCGDGPAGFNAVMRRMGKRVVSADPLYAFSAAQIRDRIEAVGRTVMEQLLANQGSYVWTTITSPDLLARLRMDAMAAFLDDYDQGRAEGRYLACELPELAFPHHAFDLGLCSHLLFTYSEQLSTDFHQKAVLEMCRVAGEVRIFPLLDMSGEASPHVDPVCGYLGRHGYAWAIETVDYEFQRGGNQMLRVFPRDGRAGNSAAGLLSLRSDQRTS